ncbi:MAG: radical SAM protein [Oligoflexia bacterium]|nr:radical SAM protein [Oligoflexia bacterium]
MKHFNFWLYISRACNLRCTYCYQRHQRDMMTLHTAKITIEWIIKNAAEFNVNTISLDYYGGEPLLNFDVFKYLLEYSTQLSKQNGITVDHCLFTNGMLMDSKTIELIKQFGVTTQMSIDGPPEVHDANRINVNGDGSYKKIIDNMRKNRAIEELSPIASMVVTPENIKSFYDNIIYLRDLGFKRIIYHLALDKDVQWGKEEAIQLLEAIVKIINVINLKFSNGGMTSDLMVQPLMDFSYSYYRELLRQEDGKKNISENSTIKCGAGRNNFSINYNGDIYPCSRIVDDINIDEVKNNYRIGNVHLGIWNKENLEKFKSWMPRMSRSSKCSECNHRYCCSYQCFALSENNPDHLGNSTSKESIIACTVTETIANEIKTRVPKIPIVPTAPTMDTKETLDA